MAGGFLLAAGIWLTFAMALVQFKVWNLRPAARGDWVEFVWVAAAVALGVAVLLEMLFRGIAMKVFLRAMRPLAAGIMASLLFVLVMAAVPPPDMALVDPEMGNAGLGLLRQTGGLLLEWRHVATWLLPWAVVGGILARARWRTASLWLPVGLHAAWYFTRALEGRWLVVAAGHAASAPWLLGLPALAVLLAGLLMDSLIRDGGHD